MDEVRLIYHDGDRVDWAMAARAADVLVVLTRFVSHGVWRLKEFAVERGKEIVFVRETGTKRILDRISEKKA